VKALKTALLIIQVSALSLGLVFFFSCGDDPSTGSGQADDSGDDDADDDDNDVAFPDPAVQALLEEYVAFTGEPGIALAWSRQDGPMRIQTAGLANLQLETPLDTDSVFRIGSGTKPFVAAVIMQLVDEDLIGLDDPVESYLPEYTQWPGLTVRHLLAMQSGILDYLNSLDFWLYALVRLGEPFTPDQLIRYALDLGPAFLPGEGCDYSDSNYVLLGMIIERVTGNSAADELRSRIFDPLELSSTFLDQTGQVLPDLAHGYADVELAGPVIGIDAMLQSLIEIAAPQFIIEGYLMDATYMVHPTFAWTAGAMVSSPHDVAVFMRAWVQGELASEEAMAEVFDFQQCAILGEGVLYGLGLQRQETHLGDAVGHGGLHFGYSTTTYHLIESEMTYSVINNFVPDQLWFINTELLNTMHNAPLPAREACRPPDGFWDANEENLLQVSFRGPVNIREMEDDDSDDEEDVETGISGTRMRFDGIWRAYNSFGAYASFDGSRFTVESTGPKRSDEWDTRSLSLDFKEVIFDYLDENGFAEIDNDRLNLFVPLVFDTELEVEPGVLKMCFYAVPDAAETSQFYFCDSNPPPENPGDTMKVFANIPMTRDETAIEEYMAYLGLTQCICMDLGWNWEPC